MNFNKILIIICIIGACFCGYYSLNKNNASNFNLFNKPQNKITTPKDNTVTEVIPAKPLEVAAKYVNEPYTKIDVNYPVSLSYLTRKNVQDLRKRYVSQSIFDSTGYEPSDFVFGQIEDKKPWMSTNMCDKSGQKGHNINGPSEESRFIVNPTMLVAIEYPFYLDHINDLKWCESQEAMMLPKSISYSGPNKEITVTYISFPIVIQNNSFYQFNGINAKDLGYKYFYVDESKSTYKLQYSNDNNPSKEVMEFKNFIHLGSSCGVEGGCNNGSPRQPAFEFTYTSDKYTQQNARIYIKLWKERPSSPKDPADINEIIIFENV